MSKGTLIFGRPVLHPFSFVVMFVWRSEID